MHVKVPEGGVGAKDEESKWNKKEGKLPKINNADLVLAYPASLASSAGSDGSSQELIESLKNKHMLAVVDSSVEGLLIIKIVLREVDDLDDRNYNLYSILTANSEWKILRVCSLENFNKSYVGFDSF